MLAATLLAELETAVLATAHRTILSVDDYLAMACTDALALEVDRARVDSYLAGEPAVPHERAREWLMDLAQIHHSGYSCQRCQRAFLQYRNASEPPAKMERPQHLLSCQNPSRAVETGREI